MAFVYYDGNYYEQEIYTRCPKKAEAQFSLLWYSKI